VKDANEHPSRMINVTRQIRDLIRGAADPARFRETAVEREDGTFDIPIDDDTREAIVDRALPGELVGETIERVIMLANSDYKSQ
jgi:hypothetical protein